MSNERVKRMFGRLRSQDKQSGSEAPPTQRARPRAEFTWNDFKVSLKLLVRRSISSSVSDELTLPDLTGQYDHELYVRWLQAICLIPFFRESQVSSQLFDTNIDLCLQLRHRLTPYLKAVVASSRDYKWPILSSFEKAEPDNSKARGIDDCYLLGSCLFVAPVINQSALQRYVYLPSGQWYNFWNNQGYAGAQYIAVEAPLDKVPIFVRAGTTLPLLGSSHEETGETLVYRIYPGEHETVLYEDDTRDFEHERGDYRWLYITAGWDDGKLIIRRRVAGQYSPQYTSIRVEIVGLEGQPHSIRIDHRPAPLWFVDDGILEFTTDTFQIIEIAMTGDVEG